MALPRLNMTLQSLRLQSLSDSRCEGTVSTSSGHNIHDSRCTTQLDQLMLDLALGVILGISRAANFPETRETLLFSLTSFLTCHEHRSHDQREALSKKWLDQLNRMERSVFTGRLCLNLFTTDSELSTLYTSSGSNEMYSMNQIVKAILLGAPWSRQLFEQDEDYTTLLDHLIHSIRSHSNSSYALPFIQTVPTSTQYVHVNALTLLPTVAEIHDVNDDSLGDQASNTDSNDQEHDPSSKPRNDTTQEICVICLEPVCSDHSSNVLGNAESNSSGSSSEVQASALLTRCRQCNKCIHSDCMDGYLAHHLQAHQGDVSSPARCPLCRAEWHTQIKDEFDPSSFTFAYSDDRLERVPNLSDSRSSRRTFWDVGRDQQMDYVPRRFRHWDTEEYEVDSETSMLTQYPSSPPYYGNVEDDDDGNDGEGFYRMREVSPRTESETSSESSVSSYTQDQY